MMRHVLRIAQAAAAVLILGSALIPASDNQKKNDAKERTIGRPVRILSIGFAFCRHSIEKVSEIVDQEADKEDVDVIILPEVWHGNSHQPLDGPAVTAMTALARKHKTYICCPLDRWDAKRRKRYNSVVFLDRVGRIACVYDKIFPTTVEFRETPPRQPGEDTVVYNADFGRIGFAVCFDVCFPEVWRRLADQGAELVLWPSAYTGGTSLQAHALNHNFYIVASTLHSDCSVYDITGELLLFENESPFNISRITLDLDRGIYSTDFNMARRDKLLKEHADDVLLDKWQPHESWFVLRAKRPGVSARGLAAEYGLEELRSYITRSRNEANRHRGRQFAENLAASGSQ